MVTAEISGLAHSPPEWNRRSRVSEWADVPSRQCVVPMGGAERVARSVSFWVVVSRSAYQETR